VPSSRFLRLHGSPLNAISLDARMETVRRHVPSLTAIVFALVFVVRAGAASACTCTEPPVKEAFSHAEAVFVGAVSSLGLDYSKHERITDFSVQRVFKGSVPEHIRVVSALSEAACGYPFARATSYLVFTRTLSGRPFTWLCAGNRAIAAGAQPPPDLGCRLAASEVGPIVQKYGRLTTRCSGLACARR